MAADTQSVGEFEASSSTEGSGHLADKRVAGPEEDAGAV